jgi:DNA-binding transcriptional LysR family regulator
MELDWLETFLAVVDRGGFTAASEQLHRSQSRVSAHIAALERDLGVRLIDRTRRPATLTPAGEVFARHARKIVAGVGSARSAVGALRGLDQGSVTVLTTPCIGTAFFPAVLAALAAAAPGLQVRLAEQSWHDLDRRFLADGVSLAVLPCLAPPLAPGLREQLLWWEPFRVVARADTAFATTESLVPLDALVRIPLVVTGASANGHPEVQRMLADRGLAGQVRGTADNPQTLVALVRSGVGVAVTNAVALEGVDTTGLVQRGIDDAGMSRMVAAYWSDVLMGSRVGRRLHAAVTRAPVPAGAAPPAAGSNGAATGTVDADWR